MCSLFDELFAIRSLNDIMAGNRISGENPTINLVFILSIPCADDTKVDDKFNKNPCFFILIV